MNPLPLFFFASTLNPQERRERRERRRGKNKKTNKTEANELMKLQKKCFLVHEPVLKSVVRKPALVRLAEEEVPVRCDLVIHAVPDQQGQREEELGEQGKRDTEALGDLEDCLRLHVGLILLHQDDGADVVPAPSAPLQQFLARPGLQGGHPEEKESEVRSEKNSEARRRRLT